MTRSVPVSDTYKTNVKLLFCHQKSRIILRTSPLIVFMNDLPTVYNPQVLIFYTRTFPLFYINLLSFFT